MAKREIHNGHDLWAELLGILLSGPNLGMCSRNADAGGLQGHLCPLEGGRLGGGVQRGRRQPRWRRYESQPVGDGREGDRPDRPVELGLG